MPVLPLTPPANATTTTFQVGTYNALTDTFTLVYDLNDYTHTWLHNAATKFQPGKKVAVRSSNMRVSGERVVRARRPNAHITVECYIRDATPQAVVNRVHALIQAVENAPYVIRFAEPGATSYSYFDVVLCDPSPPYDPQTLNANAITHVALDFEVRPEYRGDRVTLSNLVVNPGFEAPMGGGTATGSVIAFADPFTNTSAYTLLAGSAPSVASNVMGIPAGTRLGFGSPAWSALNQWTVRWQYATNGVLRAYLHFTDASNNLWVQAFGGTNGFAINHTVAGVTTLIAQANTTLVNGTWYWFVITQFPSVAGNPPYLIASLNNDSAGALGSVITTLSGAATSASVAVAGKPALEAFNVTMNVGGTNAAVHNVRLFGPGGWIAFTTGGTGPASAAWESAWGSPTYTPSTYPNGPVTSFGAARMDFPPAGTVNTVWNLYNGGTPAGSNAIPVAAPGNVLAVSAWVKSSGLSGAAQIVLLLREFDASGTLLRTNTVQTLTGNQAAWTQIGGTWTTGASCAYADAQLNALDTSVAGASANATVWFDNAQCWNQTTTNQTTMPYCELRFPQSPAQLLVSGIVGDAPARAVVECGLYCSSFPQGNTITLYLGRRQLSTANGLLASPGWTYQPTFTTSVLDGTSYGGFYLATSIGNSDIQNISTQPGTGIPTPADLAGVYHVVSRLWTADATPASVWVSAYCDVELGSQMASLSRTDLISRGQGPRQFPFSTGSAWTLIDAGQVFVPPSPLATLTDATKTFVRPFTGATGSSSTRYAFQSGFNALLPVDGDLYIAKVINPAGANYAVTSQWLYVYADATRATNTFSVETAALANPAHAGGSPGSTSSVVVNVNSAADSGIRLDPTGGVSIIDNNTKGLAGVNQFCLIAADNTAAILPCAVDIVYSPVYLFPR